ncbi:MAG TPA: NADH-quinone oxidoreductase subunit M [Acidimicrobiia bacterium]|nr:NADH-quinone oxidoreductase subunit M [Acidimicrobiia bacterium]
MEYLLDGWGITLATFSPLVGVAIMLLIPREREDQHRMVALVTSLWVAFVGLLLLFWFDLDATGRLQYVVDEMWIDVIRSRYMVGIDGMSLPLILLTMLIVPLCIIYSWDHFPEPRNPKAFLILILILETGMIGTFVAQDMVLFFVFFEIVLLPMFFMIAVWGGPNRRYASLKFFLFTLFGSALMLVSFLALFFLTGAESFVFAEIADNVLSHGVSRTAQLWIFGGMFLGFGIKVPMFPFHTWLPDAHTEAPTVGSVILAAVLLKLGTYGFIRVAIPILPEAAVEWAPWIGLLAVVGIIYGALGCLAQTDMKRLIAFSSVAHMGFVMLAIATLTDFGINAAIMGMVAHGLITGMLFFLAGSIKERYHTLEISRLGGLLVQAPRMGWIFGICAMASLGLPGLAGFWGEFPAILSAYSPANGLPVETFRTFMVIAALGTVLAAGYLLWLLQRVAFGSPPDEFAENPDIVDVTRHEWLAWAPILAFIVAIGIYPNLVFRVTDGAVDASLNTCLKVNVVELSAAEIEALGCADAYDIGGGDEHAAVGG